MGAWSRLSLLSLLLAAPAAAGLSAEGYVKNVWVASRSPIDARPYFQNTSRARLTLDAKASVFNAHVDYDHEALAGSFFRTKDYAFFGLAEPQEWLTMEQNLSTSTTHIWRHRLYRGWVGVEGERGVLRLGRQRIAWGTGKIWNPIDVLNPYQPTSVERDQRRGVDAAYARVSLGDLSQAEAVWAPRDAWTEHALLARLRSNARGWDASVVGGKLGLSTGAWMAGGDFAGELWDGTLHGEWSYTHPERRQDYWKAGLGWDYTFDPAAWPGLRETQLVVEYLHNGAGETDWRKYRFGDVLSGREVVVGRHYSGVSIAKDVHPLLKLEVVWLTNLVDGSTFANPSLTWNALEDLYLSAGLQRFGGPRRTEFGRLANIVHVVGQYFF